MAFRQRLEMEVEGHDDPIAVEYSAIDLRAWERDTDKSSLIESTTLNMLTWLGWHAARRQGLLNGVTGATWSEFDAVCVEVRTVRSEAGDADRPTPPTQSAASSPP